MGSNYPGRRVYSIEDKFSISIGNNGQSKFSISLVVVDNPTAHPSAKYRYGELWAKTDSINDNLQEMYRKQERFGINIQHPQEDPYDVTISTGCTLTGRHGLENNGIWWGWKSEQKVTRDTGRPTL